MYRITRGLKPRLSIAKEPIQYPLFSTPSRLPPLGASDFPQQPNLPNRFLFSNPQHGFMRSARLLHTSAAHRNADRDSWMAKMKAWSEISARSSNNLLGFQHALDEKLIEYQFKLESSKKQQINLYIEELAKFKNDCLEKHKNELILEVNGLRKGIQDDVTILKAEKDKFVEKLDALKKSIDIDAELVKSTTIQELNLLKNELLEEVISQKVALEHNASTLKSDQAEFIDKLNTLKESIRLHAEQVTDAKKQELDALKKKLSGDIASEIESGKSDVTKTLELLRKSIQEDVSILKEDRDTFVKQLEALEQSINADAEQLKQATKQELDSLKKKLLGEIANEIESSTSNFTKTLELLRKSIQEDASILNEEKDKFIKKLESLQQSINTDAQQVKQATKQELDALKNKLLADIASEIESGKSDIAKTLELLKKSIENEIHFIKTKKDTLFKELEALKDLIRVDSAQIKGTTRTELEDLNREIFNAFQKKYQLKVKDFETLEKNVTELLDALDAGIKTGKSGILEVAKKWLLYKGLLVVGGPLLLSLLVSLAIIAFDSYEAHVDFDWLTDELMDLLLEYNTQEQRLKNKEIELSREKLDALSALPRQERLIQIMKIRMACLLWSESEIPFFRNKANLAMALLHSNVEMASYLYETISKSYHKDGVRFFPFTNDNDAELYWFAGCIKLQNGELENARQDFRASLQIAISEKNKIRSEIALARVYSLQKNEVEASKYLTNALNRLQSKTSSNNTNLILIAQRDLLLILKDADSMDNSRISDLVKNITASKARDTILYKQAKIIEAIANAKYFLNRQGVLAPSVKFSEWEKLIDEYKIDHNLRVLLLELAAHCKKIQKKFPESFPEKQNFSGLDIDQNAFLNITTDYQYALLAKKMYDPNVDVIDEEPALANWVPLISSKNFEKFQNRGFLAAAYYNKKNNELLIAFRGTVLHEIENLKANILGALLDEQAQIFTDAHDFTQEALKACRSHDKYGRIKLTFTGHSLGAWLAECTLWDTYLTRQQNDDAYGNVEVGYAVTFDSPGSASFINKKLRHHTFLSAVPKPNITCYLSTPNLVNTAKQHSGKMIHLLGITHDYNKGIWPSLFSLFKLRPAKNSIDRYISNLMGQTVKQAIQTLDTHKMERIVEKIRLLESSKNTNDVNALRVISWPQGVLEHAAYLQLHDMASRAPEGMALNLDSEHQLRRTANYWARNYNPFKASRKDIDAEVWKYLITYINTNGTMDDRADPSVMRYRIKRDTITVDSGMTINQLERYVKNRIGERNRQEQPNNPFLFPLKNSFFYTKYEEMRRSTITDISEASGGNREELRRLEP